MANEKENDGVIVGVVDAPVEVKYNANGKCQAKLKFKRTETWDTGSREIFLTFSLFGKPAEELDKANPSVGTAVRVAYRLGSWEAKNKAGEMLGFHNPALNAWRVDVRTEQPAPNAAHDDIPF